MTPIKYLIINNLTDVYTYSNYEELQNIVEYRRKDALGWSDRFSSFGPEIIKNLKLEKKKNETRKINNNKKV